MISEWKPASSTASNVCSVSSADAMGEPIVRSILAAIPRSLGRLGVFADDVGLSVRYRFEAMLAVEPGS